MTWLSHKPFIVCWLCIGLCLFFTVCYAFVPPQHWKLGSNGYKQWNLTKTHKATTHKQQCRTEQNHPIHKKLLNCLYRSNKECPELWKKKITTRATIPSQLLNIKSHHCSKVFGHTPIQMMHHWRSFPWLQ